MAEPNKILRVGPFVVDPARGSVTRDGESLKLRPKSFQVLLFLLQNSGRVVTKQEILDAVWANVAVTEDSLVQCLVDIRKTLGREAHQFIRTVPRRGYLCEFPEGNVQERVETKSPQRESGRKWWNWGLAATTVVLFLAALWMGLGYGRASRSETRSILILPFTSVTSPDDAHGSMNLALADLLVTHLGSLRQVIVRPMSAVARYSGQQVDPIDAGKKQRVDYVLEGGLQEAVGEVQASVRLWSVTEGKMVWAKVFTEPSTKLLSLEDAISGRIADALELHLTTEERRRLRKRLTENPEAAKLYERGRHHRDQGTRADIEKAEKFFKAAVGADPNFARAYVALADTYMDFSSPLHATKAETEREIRLLLDKALDLDDELGDAHAGMAMMLQSTGDYAGAEEALLKASRLAPNSPYVVLANYKQRIDLGDYDRALLFARRGCDLDPLSSRACELPSLVFVAARRFDEAIAGFRQLLASDPNFLPARSGLGTSYLGKKLYAQAITEFESVLKVERAPERIRFCLLAFAYARAGRTAEARAMLDQMIREREHRLIRPQFFAVVYAGLGETDKAFELLDQAYPDRPGKPLIRIDNPSIDIALEVLREDRRYHQFAQRKGFAVH